jgi:hypothetical protein
MDRRPLVIKTRPDVFAVLGSYAAEDHSWLPNFREIQLTPLNMPEERRPQLHCGGRKVQSCLLWDRNRVFFTVILITPQRSKGFS